jgi:hypothetical protein
MARGASELTSKLANWPENAFSSLASLLVSQ